MGDRHVSSASPAAYRALCAALVGFALGYALPGYARLPNLLYDPIARTFFVARGAGAVPMAWYGQLLFGAAGALVAGAAALLFSRLRPGLGDRGAALGAAWALTALLLVAAWFSWNNWP